MPAVKLKDMECPRCQKQYERLPLRDGDFPGHRCPDGVITTLVVTDTPPLLRSVG